MVKAAEKFRNLPLVIDQSGDLTLSQIANRVRSADRKHKLRLIGFDYLQLIGGSNHRSNGNRTQELTEITTVLKVLAKELGVPVVALSQLNRNVEGRPDKRPQLSDLRESGSIEQDADVVLLLHREVYYHERNKPADESAEYPAWLIKMNEIRDKAEVNIAKNRHGPVSIVELKFDADITTFKDKGAVE
jgi:replicative DNA helicase